jgi:hypothetical protein
MRLPDEVGHEAERRRLIDPRADPPSVSDIRRLEEAESLYQEGLLLRISADGDARSTLVNLENGKRVPGDSKVGMAPGFDFGSSGQGHAESPNPTQRIEFFPWRRGRRGTEDAACSSRPSHFTLRLNYQHNPGAVRRYVSDTSWFSMNSATSAREMRTVKRKLPM